MTSGEEWPVKIDGREFNPIPESWIEAGTDAGQPRNRLYAVSAAVSASKKWFRIRYAHPKSGNVLLAQHGVADNPTGDGVVPAGLAQRTGWERCLTPSPHAEPVEPLRDVEWSHFRTLWENRLSASIGSSDPDIRTDGGVEAADDGAKFVGIDPDEHLGQLEFILNTFASNPLKSTVSSREIADELDLRTAQATAILNQAQKEGLVERWSAQNQHGNPKWLLQIDNGGSR